MELKRLCVRRKHDGSFGGDLEVDLAQGEIKLILNANEVRQVLEVCADSLARISHDAAARMKEAICSATRKAN